MEDHRSTSVDQLDAQEDSSTCSCRTSLLFWELENIVGDYSSWNNLNVSLHEDISQILSFLSLNFVWALELLLVPINLEPGAESAFLDYPNAHFYKQYLICSSHFYKQYLICSFYYRHALSDALNSVSYVAVRLQDEGLFIIGANIRPI
jgi:hypothetical protein